MEPISPFPSLNAAPETEPSRIPAWRRAASGVLELLETIGLAALFYLVVGLATARVVVDGPSMRPTLVSGEWIVVNRLAYLNGPPRRGNVVVILPPMSGQTDDLIKRVIGQPGETVQIHEGAVFINGSRIAEPYEQGRSSPDGEWKLGPGEVFLMGDNRELSLDSRSFGPVATNKIVGQAVVIYWPPAEWGLISWREVAAGSHAKSTNLPSPTAYPVP